MQKKFVFKKKNVSEDAEKTREVLIYTPSDMDSKDIEIKVKDVALAEQLGLPTENFDDSVIVEFGAKETQSKLIIKEKDKDEPEPKELDDSGGDDAGKDDNKNDDDSILGG